MSLCVRTCVHPLCHIESYLTIFESISSNYENVHKDLDLSSLLECIRIVYHVCDSQFGSHIVLFMTSIGLACLSTIVHVVHDHSVYSMYNIICENFVA